MVLQIEPNIKYRKYKESAHISLLVNLIRQPSLDIPPIRIPVISKEVGKLQFADFNVLWELFTFAIHTANF
jgi:hypothetical protein